MTRRRVSRAKGSPSCQDPGKDLFAYLFIMVTIFSVMMLKTAEQNAGLDGQAAPRPQAGAATLAEVPSERIGHLEQRGGELVLVFGRTAYSPRSDLPRLRRDGCIALVRGENGQEKSLLYLEEDRRGQVLLNDYLEAFGQLSQAGVGVAFVEKVRP